MNTEEERKRGREEKIEKDVRGFFSSLAKKFVRRVSENL